MGQETVTEYEVEQKEVEVEMFRCDCCGELVAPMEEIDPIQVVVNPEIVNIEVKNNITDEQLEAMLKNTISDLVHKYQEHSEVASVFQMGKKNPVPLVESDMLDENEAAFQEILSCLPHGFAMENGSRIRETLDANIEVSDISADISKEVCPDCAVREYGIDVPREVYDVDHREMLSEKVDELKSDSDTGPSDVRPLKVSLIAGVIVALWEFMLLVSTESIGMGVIDASILSLITGTFLAVIFMGLTLFAKIIDL